MTTTATAQDANLLLHCRRHTLPHALRHFSFPRLAPQWCARQLDRSAQPQSRRLLPRSPPIVIAFLPPSPNFYKSHLLRAQLLYTLHLDLTAAMSASHSTLSMSARAACAASHFTWTARSLDAAKSGSKASFTTQQSSAKCTQASMNYLIVLFIAHFCPF